MTAPHYLEARHLPADLWREWSKGLGVYVQQVARERVRNPEKAALYALLATSRLCWLEPRAHTTRRVAALRRTGRALLALQAALAKEAA